jgi:Ca2+-binding EF-hand superfamily protein
MKYAPLLFVSLVASCAHPDPHSAEAHGRKQMALLEKFDRFDYNGNGRLTRAEIEQGIRESDVRGVDGAELDAAMKLYDVNRDGSISRWEAGRVLGKTPSAHP